MYDSLTDNRTETAMTQTQRLEFMINYLLNESGQSDAVPVPDGDAERKRLLRSLMNIRPPRLIGIEFLRVQDAYLTEEVRAKGITDSDTLPVSPVDNRLVLWRGDITTLKTDAIVNAANQ